ncbi:DNA (Cytosine-5)-methyltransferase DRM1/2 isoform 2 [Hibiscus syriacus]|uniref:DNA (Cytosine-5)-methyltransferase DRM1/2 isoform 2 n=1 Tax=Hibiscus syriacus TaxID=106335 RepID=A0A6A2ZTJ3_HIBSY|nr:DNA (Cytosine-5)-methyltransferase DRM1/2 isoform 2 [Hibiscus syriacus]
MQHVDPDNNSSDYEAIFQDDFTDIDSSSDIEEIMNSDSDEESKLLYLTKMGFSEAEASITMERCGSDSSIAELTDFICADQMAKVTDPLLMVEDRKPLCNDPNYKQRRNLGYDLWKRKKQRKLEKKLLNEDDHAVHLSIPMIDQITQRTLPEDAIESSYFYYDHLALAPVNVWTGISQYLFDVELEFVDSKHFHEMMAFLGSKNKVELFINMYRKCQIDRKDLNKVVPLESDEVEMLLEVAFYCLGILLKTDVQELNDDRLEQLMSSFVEFDLVVSGIQRNNLTGRNKHHQDELDDFCCNLLKDIMNIILTKKMIDIEEVAMMYQDLSQHQSAGSDLFMAL